MALALRRRAERDDDLAEDVELDGRDLAQRGGASTLSSTDTTSSSMRRPSNCACGASSMRCRSAGDAASTLGIELRPDVRAWPRGQGLCASGEGADAGVAVSANAERLAQLAGKDALQQFDRDNPKVTPATLEQYHAQLL